MNTTLLVLAVIFVHWVADFVFQTDKQAKGKSKNWGDLLSHTATYSFIWLSFWGFMAIFSYSRNGEFSQWKELCIYFVLITFITHTITDYFTSRLNSKLWAKGDVHNFFVSVGFDQVLHYVQLFLTLYFLTN